MDSFKPIKNKTKFTKTFHKVINLRKATKIASTNGICILTSHSKFKPDSPRNPDSKSQFFDEEHSKPRNRAVTEALISKLFASITSIKAAYAELQMAQNPYNNEAIQAADQAVVDELKAISDLKRSFLRKELDLSPQITILLSEIQEQQSLMKTYEITIKKLESGSDLKDSEISSLKNILDEAVSLNKSLEKKLNSSGSFPIFGNLQFSSLNPSHFVQFLHYTLRSIRSFVKLMVREMESSGWDLEVAVKFIEPDVNFAMSDHQNLAVESYVSKTMFEGFNDPNFTIQTEPSPHHQNSHLFFFEKFKQIIQTNPKHFLSENPNTEFGTFTRLKYLQLVHAKMECSLFGNLNQRKAVNSGCVLESAFFTAFAEMSKRVWLLHCLGFSVDEEVSVFQVRKNSRFSEVYMECVKSEEITSFSSTQLNNPGGSTYAELRVAFTVVPGFKIGKTVIQSLVYLG